MFIIWTFVHKYILVRLYAKTAQSSGWYTVDAVNNMRSCAIKSCKNYSKIVKEVSFFYFPKCSVLLEQWKIRTGCKTPNKNSSVCEKHFDIGDVRVTATRKTLRKGAIPRPCEPHPPNAAAGHAQVAISKGTALF